MEENRAVMREKLCNIAKEEYGVNPDFIVEIVVLSGILQWNYEVQVYIEH